eukprot:TRINITY_DN33685_c0_g1_i1.p1 TRINITY_DN33685_c0_g1~~TRINITY_DN33685_c0_g1_i1.p1  ORF type:complete len:544 (-),score=177.21 TRINITY_DN33685_c0_g1_i1:64-1695(-)
MSSKLEYLKKYMAAPGGGSSSTSGAAVTSMPSDGMRKKRKKGEKDRSGKSSMEGSIRMRDLSEDLPAYREKDAKKDFKKMLLAKELEGSRPDEDIELVDAERVELAQRLENETSGVKWNIKQHQKPKANLRGSAVKREAAPGPAVGRGDDSDVSPPRTRGGSAPKVKQEQGASDDDLSPPRAAPPQKVKQELEKGKDSDDDLSPPRAAKSVKKERHDSDADLSPPRKPAKAPAKGDDSDGDLSPPRPPAKSAAAASKGGRQRHDSDSDLSPPRAAPKAAAGRGEDSDLSPPRAAPKAAGSARQRHDSDSDLSPPRTAPKKDEPEVELMSSGLRSGLVRGSDLKEEAAKVRAERRKAVDEAPDDETGKGAQTVYRNREGRKVEREEWVQLQQKKKKKRASDYPEQELAWGGGLKQQASKEAEMEELEKLAAQPFARFQPDEKYIEELKGKSDWADPMRKFQEEDEKIQAGAESAAAAKTQDEPTVAKRKPKCPHAPWLNRYGILPGYRWDGKIRGNGYERRWLEAKNARANLKNEQWKYEMEEM